MGALDAHERVVIEVQPVGVAAVILVVVVHRDHREERVLTVPRLVVAIQDLRRQRPVGRLRNISSDAKPRQFGPLQPYRSQVQDSGERSDGIEALARTGPLEGCFPTILQFEQGSIPPLLRAPQSQYTSVLVDAMWKSILFWSG